VTASPVFVPIGDVCSVDSGPAFKSAYFKEAGEGIPLLRGENIEPGALRWTKTRTWPVDMLAGYEHLQVAPGDLILGMDRPIITTGLKLAMVKGADCPALLVQRVARIRPEKIDGRYLFYWLSAPDFVRHLQANSTGTQLPHVTLKSIRDFRVPRFTDDVEKRIVDMLEEHLSSLDAAKHGLEAASARLRAFRERAVLHAITGARIGSRRIQATLSSVGTADGDLPWLPADWYWARLGDVADVVGGITKGRKEAIRSVICGGSIPTRGQRSARTPES
jgi:type I restriction enzyme S subunit